MKPNVPTVLVLAALLALVAAGCGRSPEPEDPVDAAVRRSLAANPEAARTRVLLLGFDSADLDLIEERIAAGELPAFARLIREGASGKLRSIVPLLSPVVWTTIATGKGPEDHGILDWEVADPVTGEAKPSTSRQRRVEAIWEILSNHGEKVGTVGWLATWPAEPVNGFSVTNRFGYLAYRNVPAPGHGHRVYPPELFPRLAKLIRDVKDIPYEEMARFLHVSEERYRASFARESSPDNPENNLRLYYAAAESYRRVGLELWRTEKPRFQATYWKFLDSAGHLFMLFAPPKTDEVTDEEFARYRGAVAEAYRYSDRQLAEAMAAADENTVVLVVSDHGFKSGRQRPPRGAKFHDRWASRWHRHYGVFFAWGKGVRPGARVTGATVYDVAPTVLGLMGFPLAEDMRGRFLKEAFTVSPPGETVPTYETDRAARIMDEIALDADDPQVKDLAALGYIGGGKKTLESHMHLGAHFLSEGNLDDALRECRKALAKEPESPRALNFLGRVMQQKGQFEAAEDAFRRALAAEPALGGARVSLGLTLKILGRPEEAIEQLSEAVRRDPDDAQARFHLSRVLRETGAEGEGLRQLRLAVEIEPDYPEARNDLGQALLLQGKVDAAIDHFRAALDLYPKYQKARNNLGVALLQRAVRTRDPQRREEALDAALETMDGTVELFPDYALAYGNRARLYLLRNQVDSARTDLEKAVELDPDYREARALLERLR